MVMPNYDKRMKSVQELEQVRSQLLASLPASVFFLADRFNSNQRNILAVLVKLEDEGQVRLGLGDFWYRVDRKDQSMED